VRLPENFLNSRKFESLVEGQFSYTLNPAAMHIFEAHQQAGQVLLQYGPPVLAGMNTYHVHRVFRMNLVLPCGIYQ
jgi:hypothetical protein